MIRKYEVVAISHHDGKEVGPRPRYWTLRAAEEAAGRINATGREIGTAKFLTFVARRRA